MAPVFSLWEYYKKDANEIRKSRKILEVKIASRPIGDVSVQENFRDRCALSMGGGVSVRPIRTSLGLTEGEQSTYQGLTPWCTTFVPGPISPSIQVPLSDFALVDFAFFEAGSEDIFEKSSLLASSTSSGNECVRRRGEQQDDDVGSLDVPQPVLHLVFH